MLQWWRRRRCDEESRSLWESLRRAESACPACRCIERQARATGLAVFFTQDENGDVAAVNLRFCPACGRRLAV